VFWAFAIHCPNMKTFIVFVDYVLYSRKPWKYLYKTKRFEIKAFDIIQASELALAKQPGEVSMIWPEV